MFANATSHDIGFPFLYIFYCYKMRLYLFLQVLLVARLLATSKSPLCPLWDLRDSSPPVAPILILQARTLRPHSFHLQRS